METIDFRKVVLADQIAGALREQGLLEGLTQSEDLKSRGSSSEKKLRQRALAFLVLFDEVVLTSSFVGVENKEAAHWTIPILEDAGIASTASVDASPLWHENRSLAALADSLGKTRDVRPFLLNELCKGGALQPFPKFADFLATEYEMSERTAYNAILDFAVATVESDADPEVLEKVAERYRIEEVILRWMFTSLNGIYSELGIKPLPQPDDEIPSHIGFLYLVAISTQYLRGLLRLGIEHGAGVATERYSGSGEGWSHLEGNVPKAGRGFALLRCALHAEGTYFPQIDGIRHALHLRDHPDIQAFREQLRLFQHYLALGDNEATVALAVEVRKAKTALKRSSRGKRMLEWVAYFSLPISVIESLAVGPPFLGVSLSVASVMGNAMIKGMVEKHRWVLFGS
jgi:hypothetical protein